MSNVGTLAGALSAASGAGGGTVIVDTPVEVSSTVVVPDRVVLRGSGRAAVLSAADGFTGDYVVQLGDSTRAFECIAEDLHIETNGLAGGVYSNRVNEKSGVRRLVVSGVTGTGVRFENTGANQAQNFVVEDVEVYLDPAAGSSATGVAVDLGGADCYGGRRITVAVEGMGTLAAGGTALAIDGAGGDWSGIHVEGVATGVSIGGTTAAAGVSVCGVTGHSSVSDVVLIGTSDSNQSIHVAGVRKKSATNVLRDIANSVTLTDATLGMYAVGTGSTGTRPVVCTSPGVSRNV